MVEQSKNPKKSKKFTFFNLFLNKFFSPENKKNAMLLFFQYWEVSSSNSGHLVTLVVTLETLK